MPEPAPPEELTLHAKAAGYSGDFQQRGIPGHEACALVSAALVALQDNDFRQSYESVPWSEGFPDYVVQACARVLSHSGIPEDGQKTILRHFEATQKHDGSVVGPLVREIHSDIFSSVSRNVGGDVLGRFYEVLVGHAGSDQAMGLVLTPEHIADLFCDLVHLTPKDVVYDPCCGTGGFLITALRRMAALGEHGVTGIDDRQLIGSEIRPDMFAYACSGLLMRGGRHPRVFNEDCFSATQKTVVRSFGVTVAFLNPPYSKTSGPAEQLRFVQNALEGLVPGGRCAAILQMGCALASKKDVVQRHRELLEKHCLEAVISCPDQLFYPAAVNTCIMVFTAHTPHLKGPSRTWFGYFKDDGFVIHKKRGRIPSLWPQKAADLLESYRKVEVPGFSVWHSVGAEDEWCAEAYMETDFSALARDHFQRKLRSFLGWMYVSGRMAAIRPEAASPQRLDLQPHIWKTFRFDEVFDIRKGYYNKKPPLSEGTPGGDGEIVFIGATANENGVTSVHHFDDVLRYSKNGDVNLEEPASKKIFPKGALTVSNNGSVGNAFYQPEQFTCSHDVNPLYLQGRSMSPELGLFLSVVIEMDKYRWGYGRKWRPSRMPDSVLKLPVDSHGRPDWDWMVSYIRTLDQSINLQPVGVQIPLPEPH